MSEYISDVMIDEIRSSNHIIDVVSEYVQLEKRGKDFFGLCPFHREKTPSFTVIPNKEIYYCFGCNKGGNVIHFMMDIEKIDFREALKHLADRAKITLPDKSSGFSEKEALLKKDISELNREAARHFYNTLVSENGKVAREYLSGRQISEKTARRFGLGFASQEWDSLFKTVQHKGYSPEAIERCGLFSINKNGGFYDKFRNRLMFPIFNITGSVIAFGGRLIDNTEGPKYMNSPETPVYTKGRHLYALNFAKAVQNKQIFVVEGYMDVISMHQSGFVNTVASLGTALTENQARILKKYAEELVICYDSDSAGQAATLRGLDILKNIGCNVKVLTILDAKDPDEYIRKNGTAAFKEMVANSHSLVEYKVAKLKEKFTDNSVDGRKNLIVEIAKVLLQVDTAVEREMYVEKFATEYNISQTSLLELIDTKLGRVPESGLGKKTSGLRSDQTTRMRDSKALAKCIYVERMLLTFLCMENNVLKFVKNEIEPNFFTGEENVRIAETVFKTIESGTGITIAGLLDRLEPDLAGVFAALVQKDCMTDDVKAAVISKLKDLKNNRLDLQIEKAREAINNTVGSDELIQLTGQVNDLVRQRKRGA